MKSQSIASRLLRRFVAARVRPHVLSVLGERLGTIGAPMPATAGARLIGSFAAMSAALYRGTVAASRWGLCHLGRALWSAPLERGETVAAGDCECAFRWESPAPFNLRTDPVY